MKSENVPEEQILDTKLSFVHLGNFKSNPLPANVGHIKLRRRKNSSNKLDTYRASRKHEASD
jgi:hypothetical protein